MSDSRASALRFVLFASGVTAIGGFLFGYDTAVINGANSYIKELWDLKPAWEGTATASMLLGCIPGAMFAGFLSDRFGRKRLLFLCAILYAVSGVLSAFPPTAGWFLAVRFLGGLGIGASSMVCPVYIAEIAPEEWRGRLGTLFQLAIVVGIFLTLFVNMLVHGLGDEAWNTAIGWRWMLGLEAVPAVAFLFLLFAVPESPRWLAQQGREAEAEEVLRRAGGAEHAQRQMGEIRAALAEEVGRFSELLTGPFRRPLLIAVLLMAFSQLCGINAIIYYSTRIFAAAGAGKEVGAAELKAAAFTSTVWIGLVNLAFTLVAIGLIDRAGRRPLLILGSAVQTAALAMVGWMYHTHPNGFSPEEAFWLLVCVVTFTAAFAMSTGPIGWLLCSEIFPNRVRGRAMSVAAMTVWITDYIVTWSFPKLNDEWVGPAGTFWIYGGVSLLALLFVLAAVPETKGRTLEEIERSWTHY
jgi:SP family arabinose:H+ symporter-like MFS transporter